MIVEFDPERRVEVWAAGYSKREKVQPILWNPKRVLRNLWLVRATEPHAVFMEEASQALALFSEQPPLGYPDFAEDLAQSLSEPYVKPKEDEYTFRRYAGAPDLPPSANSFTLKHANGRTRIIPDFKTQVRKKIASDFPWDQLHGFRTYGEGTVFDKEHFGEIVEMSSRIAEDDAERFSAALEAYASVDQELLGFIGETVKKIKRLPPVVKGNVVGDFYKTSWQALTRQIEKDGVWHNDPEVYYGRDARWLYLARKADQIGLKPHNILHYVVASRNILDSEVFEKYVQTLDLPYDAYHIDSGINTGTGIQKVLSIVSESEGTEQKKGDFEKRARAIAATNPRLSLFPRENQGEMGRRNIDLIEHRIPGNRPQVFRTHRDGSMDPQFNPESWLQGNEYVQELQAWAMEQAVVRHFLPKSGQ